MIDFNFSKHCTGCAACASICPHHCITMVTDEYDFIIPKVNKSDCVDCGLCNRVCPYLTPSLPNSLDQHAYSAYNRNEKERKIGSSGSIMILLAKHVLSNGGVVYGAEFEGHLQLKHTRATSLEEVIRQSKSKYLQSDTNGVYALVKKDIRDGLNVLFVGTPCQTQALYNYLGKKIPENLILVDFICHGVPSQALFDKAIVKYEEQNHCIVTNFSFREKSEERLRSYKIEYKKGIETGIETGTEDEFPFYCGYLKYSIFRESCYECRFANTNRITDITLGDMWGLEFKKEIADFKRGYSLLYVNSKKGKTLLDSLNEAIEKVEYSLESPETRNYAFRRPPKKTFAHRAFRRMYRHVSYDTIEQWFFANNQRANAIQKIAFKLYVFKAIPKVFERYGAREATKRLMKKIIRK